MKNILEDKNSVHSDIHDVLLKLFYNSEYILSFRVFLVLKGEQHLSGF
jgi:hypothetical protein